MLIRSGKGHKENNYVEYVTKDINNEIHSEINKIRKQLVNVSSYLKKEYLNQIRKRLYEIEKKTKMNRNEKKNCLMNYVKYQLILNLKIYIYVK